VRQPAAAASSPSSGLVLFHTRVSWLVTLAAAQRADVADRLDQFTQAAHVVVVEILAEPARGVEAVSATKDGDA
jgi:hypothetical protein